MEPSQATNRTAQPQTVEREAITPALPPAPDPALSLIAKLGVSSFKARTEASSALQDMGSAAYPALMSAREGGPARDPEIRARVWQLLEAISLPQEGATGIVQQLGQVISDPQMPTAERQAAIRILQYRPDLPVSALPGIVEATRTEVMEVVAGKMLDEPLRARPEDIPALKAMLKNQDEEVRYHALRSLAGLKDRQEELVPTYLSLLKDNCEMIREDAADLLSLVGPKAREATPTLLEMLTSPSFSSRQKAASVLGNIEPVGSPVIPALMRAMNDEAHEVRSAAYKALGKVAGDNAEVFDALFAKLGDPSATDAELALGAIQLRTGSVLPRMMERLGNPAAEVRIRAAIGIQRLEPREKTVGQLLVGLMKDADPAVRAAGAAAMGDLREGTRLTADALFDALSDPAESVRKAAAAGLTTQAFKYANRTASFVDSFVERFKSPEARVRAAAAVALGEIGDKHIPFPLVHDETFEAHNRSLAGLLKDPNAAVRAAASESLGRRGTLVADVEKELFQATADPDPTVARLATQGFMKVRLWGSQQYPELIELLRTGKESQRLNAAEALEPTNDITAVPALAAALKDPSDLVREAALKTLRGMGSNAAAALPQIRELGNNKGFEAQVKDALMRIPDPDNPEAKKANAVPNNPAPDAAGGEIL